MQDNKLYQFIRAVNPALQLSPKLKDNREVPFLMYELPIKAPLELKSDIARLCLDSVHISIYSLEDPKNPELSEYHCTAYFFQGDDFYRLHVYFDRKDRLTEAPKLSLQTTDGKYQALAVSEDDAQIFTEFATHMTRDFICALRKAYQVRMVQDQTQFLVRDDKLISLSYHLETDKDSYLAALRETIDFLRGIIPYHYDSAYYEAIQNFFITIETNLKTALGQLQKANLEEKEEVPVAAEVREEEESEEEESREESYDKAETIEPHEKPPPVILRLQEYAKKLESAQTPLGMAQQAYDLYNPNACDLHNIELLNRAYQLAKEAFLFLSEETHESSWIDLRELSILLQKHEKERERLLKQFLFAGQFDLAYTLMGASALSESNLCILFTKLISMALVQDNAKLLSFLLHYYPIPINTFVMDLKSTEENLSPVMYCFLNSKKACFAVLIQQDASLMETDPATGYPLAYIVWKNQEHPLHSVLMENYLHAIPFWRALIANLQQQQASEALKKDIKKDIQQIEAMIFIMKQSNTPIILHQIKEIVTLHQCAKEIKKKLPLEDPEVKRKIADAVKIGKSLKARLLHDKRRIGVNKIDKDLLSMTIEPLESLLKVLNPEATKEFFMDSLDTQINLINKAIQFLDLEVKVERWRKNPNLPANRKERKLINQYNELYKDLFERSKPYESHRVAKEMEQISQQLDMNAITREMKNCDQRDLIALVNARNEYKQAAKKGVLTKSLEQALLQSRDTLFAKNPRLLATVVEMAQRPEVPGQTSFIKAGTIALSKGCPQMLELFEAEAPKNST